ncbi:universal stress protein [Plantibacter sp. ME-Dv--P-122b]|uniref:universal stress protein n=1 Tax=Plantibacter sp. ME-Dv--P-122b TaxID=3040300 RepID=UPI00254C4EBA|nr:universal stress protein [Plantibacter sp. ME-Dv--P-122b]
MSAHVVVGTNGSASAGRAVRWAASAAERLGVVLLVVLVLEQQDSGGVRSAGGTQTLIRAEATARVGHPGLSIQRRLAYGDVVTQLARASEATVLIVLGTDRGPQQTRTSPYGALAARLVTSAPCPVAVIPAREPGPGATLVVGIDDDVQATPVLAVAIDVAAWSGSSLDLVHAWKPAPPFLADVGPEEQHPPLGVSDAMTDIITRTFARKSDLPAGVELRVELVVGGAVDALCSAAQHASLLVIGSHGRHVLASLALGSVSRSLLSLMPCPLLIVPRSASDARLVPRPGPSEGPSVAATG